MAAPSIRDCHLKQNTTWGVKFIMNKFTVSLCVSLIFSGFTAQSALAHHSGAPHYFMDQDITLADVTVTKWAMVNPHSYIFFDAVSPETGEVESWRCEGSSRNALQQLGYTDDTFKAGQKLTISGHPARRENNVCVMTGFIFDDGTEVTTRTALPSDRAVYVETVADTAPREEYLENGQPNISGYWVGGNGPNWSSGGSYDISEAGLAAQAEYEQIYDDPSIHCDIGNIFFGWTHDGHTNSITQDNEKVTLLYGYMDFVRTIHLNMEEHPDNIVPSRGGHSIGHWEDKTLVVDTTGFTAGVLHPLQGILHSDQMHTVERIHYDPQSESLIMDYEISDPLYLNSVYTGSRRQEVSAKPYEPYNCTELSGDNNKRPEERGS